MVATERRPAKRPLDWVSARADYEGGVGTLDEICARYGMTRSALNWKVRSEVWALRNTRSGASGTALLKRLFRLLARQIFQLEKEQSQMGEKEAAMLGRVAATLDKLMEIERAATTTKRPKRSSKDLEVLRNKIARRLDELDGR